MVKAKLSEELIIEVIQTSQVQFDLSQNSMKNLSEQYVSQKIIDAMKVAGGYQNASTANPSTPLQKAAKPAEVARLPEPGGTVISSLNNESVALGYVTPIRDLIIFHEEEFEGLNSTMSEWDKKINDLTDAITRLRDQITSAEKDLREKKNADIKSYSSEILELKKKLNGYRENHRKAREDLLEEGERITKEMEKISSEQIQALGNAYNDISQDIKSAKADPSGNPVSVPVNPNRS